jgi:isocitrate dehydrogenase
VQQRLQCTLQLLPEKEKERVMSFLSASGASVSPAQQSSTATTPGAHRVTIIPGDGIGPEVVGAARRVVEATGVPIVWEECEAGAEVFRRGLASGVPQETIDSIKRTRVALKGPLATPIGYGEKSANVTLRKLFETYGNLRPVREFPGVPTPYSGRAIDLVVVRENVEDLYAGIEHMQTPGVAQCLKLISHKGCEKIVRLAFEVARAEGRKKVSCATKSNIMKLTEGLLKRVFEEVALEYPDIEAEHIIVDNCAHQLVKRPEQFDVIVSTNMNGDILSDLTSALVGGLGFAPSANIGSEVAIFEAVHGSAPKHAGKDIANPTALILTAAMLLRHLGEFQAATDIEQAVLVTLAAGIHTADVQLPRGVGKAEAAEWPQAPVGTRDFTDAVIAHLGQRSNAWPPRAYTPLRLPQVSPAPDTVRARSRRTVGVDIFVESALDAERLGKSLDKIAALVAQSTGTPLHLKMISNRGTKVYMPTGALTDCIDHWRCRFILDDVSNPANELDDATLLELTRRVAETHQWMHIEKLPEFDGAPGYTRAQGED